MPAVNPVADALTNGAPDDPVSTTVLRNFAGTGTTVVVNGATLVAERDVIITASERSDVAGDTVTAVDIMYRIANTDSSILAVYKDEAFTSIRNIAVTTVSGGAQVTAGRNVLVLGAVENDTALTATTSVNKITNTIGAYVDGATVTATGGDVDVQAVQDLAATNWAILP